jgi:hypothetical protein
MIKWRSIRQAWHVECMGGGERRVKSTGEETLGKETTGEKQE